MADAKISALTVATTPLAGTEVLPIVQSSTTKQVSVANLTAGRAVSASSFNAGATSPTYKIATDSAIELQRTIANYISNFAHPLIYASEASGGIGVNGALILQPRGSASLPVIIATGSGVGAMAARLTVDGTGDATLNTGNLVQGAAAKGVNFTANTPAAGMTSQLLNWYEEGTFTPVVIGTATPGTGTYSAQSGSYTRIGRQVTFQLVLAWSAHTGTGAMKISGLPFTAASGIDAVVSTLAYNLATSASTTLAARVNNGAATIELLELPVAGGAWSGVNMDTDVVALIISGSYSV